MHVIDPKNKFYANIKVFFFFFGVLLLDNFVKEMNRQD